MRRGGRRGVSPIIASVFLVAMTVVAGATLWAFRPQPPVQPATFYYQVSTGAGEPTWGDGSDCQNVKDPGTGQTVQTCLTLPSIDIYLTSASQPAIALSELTFFFLCNGTIYLTAPLGGMAWVPGTAATVGGSAPQLGTCGTYVPPKAAWDRLAYYDQVRAGSPYWMAGDEIVLYAHTFEPPNCPSPTVKNGVIVSCDDDFHGAPEWCYTVPGACTILLAYTGTPPTVALRVPLYGLSS